jgi:hypothetical protein
VNYILKPLYVNFVEICILHFAVNLIISGIIFIPHNYGGGVAY